MVAEVAGRVLVVPLAPPASGEAIKCRPISCYEAAIHLADQYRERPMTTRKKMTRKEEHDFYERPENQTPQGPARRRAPRPTEMVPVRFPPDVLDEVRRRADDDDRSVSAWIRRAVEDQRRRTAS